MNPSLWFIVPVHGRLPLAAICLRQLERTCDELIERGIEATAVVIADGENLLALKRRLGGLIGIPGLINGRFAGIERENDFLSARFNDGIQLACDNRFNSRPADYVVPCGSDDWVDYRALLELPPANTVHGFQDISFVRPDGAELRQVHLDYVGGCGVRIYPRSLMRYKGYRPADEDRGRGCDTSILFGLQRANPQLRIRHLEVDPRFIVDWKSESEQLTSYEAVTKRARRLGEGEPFETLRGVFPDESLEAMRNHYAGAR